MNPLKNEKSPYLRQHATNPVNWYSWGGEALRRARTEDKPILLSIGYSTCHWCHVMARESFEDPEVAQYMNDHFINIKVDREERPDLDGLYMAACEAITGKGGWPLNVFLTPESKPFYAGTYFPPEPAQRQQSWMQALQFAAYNFYERRQAVEQEAEKILLRMEKREKARPVTEEEVFFSQAELQALLERMLEKADRKNGGFGRGAKFPNTMALEFLMQLAWQTSSLPAFQHLLLSIDHMLLGGIHDHLGGGFARYTVDPQWRVPHFEKMLYDNALIAGMLANLHKWRRKPHRLQALHSTLAFMERELQHAEGGFFSALDAETEGQEGRFYTWSYDEVVSQLEEEPGYFCQYYNISKEGNWERGRNILYAAESQKAFASRKDIPAGELATYMAECHERLLQLRDKRLRPAADEKIVLPWNALACTAFARSSAATSEEHYLSVAERCLGFIRQNLQMGGQLLHSDQSAFPAFLDGYAYFIQALLEVHEASQQHSLLDEAESWMEKALEIFWDQQAGLFYYQHQDAPDTPRRQHIIREEDMPSANAVMADNLRRLGLLLGRPEWRKLAHEMLLAVGENLERSPLEHASWGTLLVGETFGVLEIAIAGEQALAKAREVTAEFFGHHVLVATDEPREDYPLLAHRWPGEGETLIYVCKDYTCRKPVEEVGDIFLQA